MNNVLYLKDLQASFLIFTLKIKNFHWNLKGNDFFETHEQLDKLFDEANEHLDALAEKIVMFDDIAIGSFEESVKYSFIKETQSKKIKSNKIYEILIADLNSILKYIEKIENVNFRIQPLIDEIVLFADTWAWKFKASNY